MESFDEGVKQISFAIWLIILNKKVSRLKIWIENGIFEFKKSFTDFRFPDTIYVKLKMGLIISKSLLTIQIREFLYQVIKYFGLFQV